MNSDRSKIPTSLGEFGEQLAISEILGPQQIEELNEKIESGRWPTGGRELASRLFYEKWLTEFQARKLLANRASELNLGRYLILDRIGGGSMGEVFMAEHQFMGRVVALKMIRQEMMSDRLIKRFQREMRLAARMNHPNVVRAYDADQVGNLFYIAMEYVPGRSLGELLKAGPLRMQDVVRYGAQAALGLDHAHQQGILHRDVKPSNILLTEGGRTIKLLDLGLGMLIEPSSGDPTLTQAGNVVGTYDYMSPEQVKGRTLDGRSDLYSLACTMYHLMTGQPPFRHEVPLKRMSMRIDTKPTPITEYLPNMPRRLILIIDKMFAVDPDERFQTGQELNDALMSLFKSKNRSAGEPTSSQENPKPASAEAPHPSAAEQPPDHEPGPGDAPVPIATEKSTFGSFADPSDSQVDAPSPWLVRHPRIALATASLFWAGSVAAAYFLGASR